MRTSQHCSYDHSEEVVPALQAAKPAVNMGSKIRWADTLDDDDVKEIPMGSTSGPDAKGVKTVIEFKKNDKGEIVKVNTRIKTSKLEKRVYKV